MNRRDLMKVSLKAMAASGLAPLLQGLAPLSIQAEGEPDYRAIVCFFMAGGMDGNNLLIPMDFQYQDYAGGRGVLAQAKSSLNPLSQTSTGRLFGTHNLMPQLAQLFNQKHAAFVANVGTLPKPVTKATATAPGLLPINMYSHASQIGEWDTAVTQGIASTGWAGRVADLYGSGAMPVVVSTAGNNLMGQGAKTQLGTASDGASAVAVLNTLSTLTAYLTQAEQGGNTDPIREHIAAFQGGFLGQTKVITDAFSAGSGLKTTFPSTSIGQQLQTVVQMVNGRSVHDTKRQIFICVDGGYDTHTDQLSMSNRYFSRIDDALASFSRGMQEIGMFENVTLFSASDFGRSLRTNSGNGSDHAWGNHHFVLGGAVQGGDVFGTFPSLALGGDDDLSTIGTWIPTTSSTQYVSTTTGWLGVAESDLNMIFPERTNFAQPRLKFV